MSFALSFAVTYVAPPVAFFSLPTRAWQLAAGGLVALTAGQWRRLPARPATLTGWAGLGAIVVASTLFSSATMYPGTAALLPTLGAMLVIGAGCATPSRGCSRVLGSSPMRAIGRISYSWYLWHWPVLVLAPALLGHPLGLAARLTAALVSSALAVLTLRFIENPLRFADPVRRSARASLALGGVASALAVCMGVALLVCVPTPIGHGAPVTSLRITATAPPAGSSIAAYDAEVQQAFAQVQAAVAASADLRAVPSNLEPPLADAVNEHRVLFRDGCMRNFFQDGQPECAAGDTASTTTVALVGDSTAAMWNPGFQQIATQRRWRLEMLSKAGCPLLDLHITSPTLHREYTECTRWRGQIISRLGAEHPRLIVLSVLRRYGARYGLPSGFTSYDSAWNNSFFRLIQELRGTGAQVLVLGPLPDPQSYVPICLSGHLDDASGLLAAQIDGGESKPVSRPNPPPPQPAAANMPISSELFCTTDRCPVIVGNTLVYLDQSHLTFEYSRLLAPAIAALADRTLAHS